MFGNLCIKASVFILLMLALALLPAMYFSPGYQRGNPVGLRGAILLIGMDVFATFTCLYAMRHAGLSSFRRLHPRALSIYVAANLLWAVSLCAFFWVYDIKYGIVLYPDKETGVAKTFIFVGALAGYLVGFIVAVFELLFVALISQAESGKSRQSSEAHGDA